MTTWEFVLRRKLHLLLILVLFALPAGAAERWEMLPPTPGPIHSERSGQANANGISIHYAVYGQGSPVILLHGGLANTDYWGNQIKALEPHHTVIVMDSRGHGRSTRDSRPYGYDLMADDVVALMDVLKVPKADIVGWSDGAILGLDLAMRHRAGLARSSPLPPTPSPRASRTPWRRIRLLILPNASHFAFLQDPEFFNYAVLHFLGDN